MAGYSGEFVRLWLGLSSNKVVKVSKLGGGWTGVTLGCVSSTSPQHLKRALEVLWASRRNTEDGRCPLEDPRDA